MESEAPSGHYAPRPKFPVRSLDNATKHVLILTTGSVASLKLPLIVKELLKVGISLPLVIAVVANFGFAICLRLESFPNSERWACIFSNSIKMSKFKSHPRNLPSHFFRNPKSKMKMKGSAYGLMKTNGA